MSRHPPPEGFEMPVPEIDRAIHAMPMFVTMPVRDLDGHIVVLTAPRQEPPPDDRDEFMRSTIVE